MEKMVYCLLFFPIVVTPRWFAWSPYSNWGCSYKVSSKDGDGCSWLLQTKCRTSRKFKVWRRRLVKKKVQKMLEWFYQESDRGEQNIVECKNVYELVEKLQYRLEDLENEHMQILRKYEGLERKLDEYRANLSDWVLITTGILLTGCLFYYIICKDLQH